ncbi:MAG: UvrD-helicase domain-containing protein [Myxococcales bacterium]|nr:UvrD-helicase domain-containing protein [Myxococcales bacterium]
MSLVDGEARRRIREDFATTLVVEAAAGTGKTTELVGRLVALLRGGHATLERVVAVTFTDKAAGEMKLRLRAGLERARSDEETTDEERGRLADALEALETANIGTIHSFCLDLLRERPVEAAVDPAFEVLPDPGAVLERAFDRWYQAALDDPPEGLRRALATRRWGRGDGPREMLLGVAAELIDKRDFPAPWTRPPFDRAARIDALLAEAEELGRWGDRARFKGDRLAGCLARIGSWGEVVRERERTRPRDYDLLEYQLGRWLRDRDAWRPAKQGRPEFGPGLMRAEVLQRRDTFQAEIERFVSDAEADLAVCLREALAEVVAGYQRLKSRAGALDYLDLLVCLRDMLVERDDVRAELQARYSHLFVDEFQDTDPLQAEILLLLAADRPDVTDYEQAVPRAGKLFVVGDPKQAIYRFRRADVLLYQRIKERLVAAGAAVLYLSTSFRAVPPIQAVVNTAFAAAMGEGSAFQARYVPLERFREARTAQPGVVALPVPDPYGSYGRVTNDAIRASEPEAVAAFVQWLVGESGWTVEERGPSGPERVPLAGRHVCLLFRGFRDFYIGDVTRSYVRGLEARRIPHVLVGGHAYHGREEVVALRAALAAIEWPHDELNVYATLRGPFFSFGDDALFAFRNRHHRLHPLAKRDGDPDDPIEQALELLARLHWARNRRPTAATIQDLLASTRAHAGLAIWPTGEQALANVMRAMDEARRFEHRGATSFRAFLEHLDGQARSGTGAEAPVVEEGTDGVRIMTVHGAKGLEFPVVVLCDMAKPRASKRPSRYLDASRRLWAFPLAGCMPRDLLDHRDEVLAQDEAEALRVAYVAATRAQDLLVVPAIGDERRGGWLDVLHPAVYPPFEAWRDAQPAPGCPAFGRDSVRYRPASAQALPNASVAPGLHRGSGVVWWDPAILALDEPPVGGLRQTSLLEAAADDEGEGAELARAHQAWAARRASARLRASQPHHRAAPITTLAHEAPSLATPTVYMTDAPRAGRPRGARFGSLVHLGLALCPHDAEVPVIEQVLRRQARLLLASEEEIVAAVTAVARAFAHELLVGAHQSPDCRREAPLSVQLDDGRIAEGIADLVFLDPNDDAYVVVDYKTDASEEGFGVYVAQLALYVRAVEAATGKAARACILRV